MGRDDWTLRRQPASMGVMRVASTVSKPRSSEWLDGRGAAAAVLGGVALGVVSRYGDRLDSQFAWVLNIGGPWLVLAFVAGVIARRPRAGAEAGAALQTIAVGVYYVLAPTFHAAHEVDAVVRLTILWGLVGAVGGAALGWAGATWRTHSGSVRAVAVALLAGVLLGEGVLLFARPGRAGAKIFFLEIAVGALLPFIMLRDRTERFRCLLYTGGLALVAVASVVLIRLAAHATWIIFPPQV